MGPIFVAVIVTAASPFALPYLLSLLGRLVGLFLRRKTDERRQLLINRSFDEEESINATSKATGPSEDEDWEKIENHAFKSAKNGEHDDEKRLIVGFFHPFW